MSTETKSAFEVPGKLEIPYRYFAGQCGSKFLIALRDEKKILGTRDPKTGLVMVPPRSVSDRSFQRTDDWVEVGPKGTVTSYTVVRQWAPHYPMKPPFAIALIKLDGADGALCHLLGEVEPEAIKIGMRVEPAWAENRNARITDIKYFRPVPAAKPAAKKAAPKKPKPVKKAKAKPAAKAAKPKAKKAEAVKPAPKKAAAKKPASKRIASGRKAKAAKPKKSSGKKPAAKKPAAKSRPRARKAKTRK